MVNRFFSIGVVILVSLIMGGGGVFAGKMPTPISTMTVIPTPSPHTDCFVCTISGYVKDETGKRIENATVNGYGENIFTNEDGYYELKEDHFMGGSCEGTPMLTASADGYISQTKSTNFTTDSCSVELSFKLQSTSTLIFIAVSPTKLSLKRGQRGEVDVTVTDGEGLPFEGVTVTATINKAGKRYISIINSSTYTDANGNAIVGIIAKKAGSARVTLKAGSVKKTIIVKVVR